LFRIFYFKILKISNGAGRFSISQQNWTGPVFLVFTKIDRFCWFLSHPHATNIIGAESSSGAGALPTHSCRRNDGYNNNNNQIFYSQASWDRLEMKPQEQKKKIGTNKNEKERRKQRAIKNQIEKEEKTIKC
jgi:hypothetical protein